MENIEIAERFIKFIKFDYECKKELINKIGSFTW